MLSRRERQIMDIVFQRKEASVTDVLEELPDPPSYSSVRTLMRILEEKGHLKHRKVGAKYLYSATVSRARAGKSALQRLLGTFFDGSVEKAVSTLLDLESRSLSEADFDRLEEQIRQARDKGGDS